MKKFLTIILLLMYGLSSMGATLHLHYCCGKLDKISFSSSHVKYDCPSGSVKTSGCCDNQQIDFKIKAEHQPGNEVTINFHADPVIHQAVSRPVGILIYQKPVSQLAEGPPLILYSVPFYLQFSNFRV